MPARGLALRWVEQSVLGRLHRTFNLGGIGTMTLHRPFNVLTAPLEDTLHRPFNIVGALTDSLSRPFNVLGPLGPIYFHRTFNLVNLSNRRRVGTRAPFVPAVATTLAAGAASGASTITVSSAIGISRGIMLLIGTQYRAVLSVAGAVVTLAAPLGKAELNGAAVTSPIGFVAQA